MEINNSENTEKDWFEDLDKTESGKIKTHLNNVAQIIGHDEYLQKKGIHYDEVLCNACTMEDGMPRVFNEDDFIDLLSLLQYRYQLNTNQEKQIRNGLNFAKKHFLSKRNFIKDWIKPWNKVKTVETLLIDYLGAEDNTLNREIIKFTLAAVYARAIAEPNKEIQFKFLPILEGPQSLGKSTFIKRICPFPEQYFSDNISDIRKDSKDNQMRMLGKLFMELPELSALDKASAKEYRDFVSTYRIEVRKLYKGHDTKEFLKGVFIGTSNESKFDEKFADIRTVFIRCGVQEPKKRSWDITEEDKQQIWAEVAESIYPKYKDKLFFEEGGEAQMQQIAMQEYYIPRSYKTGTRWYEKIEGLEINNIRAYGNIKENKNELQQFNEFIQKKVPSNWYDFGQDKRLAYLNGEKVEGMSDEMKYRDYITSKEYLIEGLGVVDPTPKDTKEITSIIKQSKFIAVDKETSKRIYKSKNDKQRAYPLKTDLLNAKQQDEHNEYMASLFSTIVDDRDCLMN